MAAQASALHLQVEETHQAEPVQDAGLHRLRMTWFFQGMCLAALMLVGLAAADGLPDWITYEKTSGSSRPSTLVKPSGYDASLASAGPPDFMIYNDVIDQFTERPSDREKPAAREKPSIREKPSGLDAVPSTVATGYPDWVTYDPRFVSETPSGSEKPAGNEKPRREKPSGLYASVPTPAAPLSAGPPDWITFNDGKDRGTERPSGSEKPAGREKPGREKPSGLYASVPTATAPLSAGPPDWITFNDGRDRGTERPSGSEKPAGNEKPRREKPSGLYASVPTPTAPLSSGPPDWITFNDDRLYRGTERPSGSEKSAGGVKPSGREKPPGTDASVASTGATGYPDWVTYRSDYGTEESSGSKKPSRHDAAVAFLSAVRKGQ